MRRKILFFFFFDTFLKIEESKREGKRKVTEHYVYVIFDYKI